jgi:hypothetical protein
MDATISPLQVYKAKDFNGLTTHNHLVNAYLREPHKMDGILAYAFGITGNSVMNLLTSGLGNTVYMGEKEFTWDLYGKTERSIEVIEDTTDGGATPGYGGTIFRVTFAEKLFEVTDNLVSDDGTQVRVQYEPVQNAVGWVYGLQLTDPDVSKFLDPTQVVTGARFSKDYSTVEEYSIKGGGVSYNTPFKLKNQLTTLRKQYGVSRNAAKGAMIIEMPDPFNPKKKTKLWTKLAEWNAMGEWMREIDRMLIYSIYNKNSQGIITLKGENQRPVFHGAGFRQQIAPANVRYYTQLTYALLDDFLTDLSYAASAWGGDHKFVALTGKMGLKEFHRAVVEEMRGQGITVTNSGTFIAGEGQELTFQGQFTTVKFLNGIELTVKEFNPYDDLVRNRKLHPVSKKPIESYRFTILNFGRKDGASNIRKVALEDSENVMWHVAGSTDPYGGVVKGINSMRSSSIDGYQVHMLEECILQVQDPTSCGELIMDVD